MTATYATINPAFYPPSVRNRWDMFAFTVDRGVQEYEMNRQAVEDFEIDVDAWRSQDRNLIRKQSSIFDLFENITQKHPEHDDINMDRTIDR